MSSGITERKKLSGYTNFKQSYDVFYFVFEPLPSHMPVQSTTPTDKLQWPNL